MFLPPMGTIALDRARLREQIRNEYREVALRPGRGFPFRTGRAQAVRLGYGEASLAGMPVGAVESFSGIANPFAVRALGCGERVLDLGCGAGLDSLVAARQIGPSGTVVGVDMTPEMVFKARRAARAARLHHADFRQGYIEAVPVSDEWADVVLANHALHLCPDLRAACDEIRRVLRPGGRLQIADVRPRARLLADAGFEDFAVVWEAPVGPPGPVGVTYTALRPRRPSQGETAHRP